MRNTFTVEWQCESHCHSALGEPIALPLGLASSGSVRSRPFGSPGRTATRPRSYRLHCHSALNVTCSTFTGEWQCEMHCHSALNVQSSTFTGEWQCRRAAGCPDCLSQRIHVGRRIEVRAHTQLCGSGGIADEGKVPSTRAKLYTVPVGRTRPSVVYMSLICGDPVAAAEVIGVGCVRTREEKGQLT